MDIEKNLEKIPPAPPEVEEWVRSLAKKRYMLFDKKRNAVVCTRCGKEYRLDDLGLELKHGMKTYFGCLECDGESLGYETEWRSAGMGRKKLAEYTKILTFAENNGIIYAVLNEIIIDFSPFGKPGILRRPSAVYTISKTEQRYYKNHPWHGWEERKEIKIPSAPRPHNWYSSSIWDGLYIYTENLQEVFEKTHLKYSYDEEFIKTLSADELIKYCVFETKNKSMEILRKSGFEKLVIGRLKDQCGKGAVNWRGESLQKILRLPMNHIRKLRAFNISLLELQAFQKLTDKEKKAVTEEELAKVAKIAWNYPKAAKKISQMMSLLKFARYWNEQNEPAYLAGDYIDYIDACEKTGLNTAKKDVLFPKNFRKAHDETIERMEIIQNSERDAEMKSATFEFRVENEMFTCFMARTQNELNAESRALNHCVRTYGDRIIKGACYIFFVRKKEEKDTPYYTLELAPDGRIVQCRGIYNHKATEEIENFINEVSKKFKKEMKGAKAA